jgi:hypothetical protein
MYEHFYVRVVDSRGKPLTLVRNDRFEKEYVQLLRTHGALRIELAKTPTSPLVLNTIRPFYTTPTFLSTEKVTNTDGVVTLRMKISLPLRLQDNTESIQFLTVESSQDVREFLVRLRTEIRRKVSLTEAAEKQYAEWFETVVAPIYPGAALDVVEPGE